MWWGFFAGNLVLNAHLDRLRSALRYSWPLSGSQSRSLSLSLSLVLRSRSLSRSRSRSLSRSLSRSFSLSRSRRSLSRSLSFSRSLLSFSNSCRSFSRLSFSSSSFCGAKHKWVQWTPTALKQASAVNLQMYFSKFLRLWLLYKYMH